MWGTKTLNVHGKRLRKVCRGEEVEVGRRGRGEKCLFSTTNSPQHTLCCEYLGQGQESCSWLSCLQRKETDQHCQGCGVLHISAVHSGCCSPVPEAHSSVVGLLAVLIPCASALWLKEVVLSGLLSWEPAAV